MVIYYYHSIRSTFLNHVCLCICVHSTNSPAILIEFEKTYKTPRASCTQWFLITVDGPCNKSAQPSVTSATISIAKSTFSSFVNLSPSAALAVVNDNLQFRNESNCGPCCYNFHSALYRGRPRENVNQPRQRVHNTGSNCDFKFNGMNTPSENVLKQTLNVQQVKM